MDTYSQALENFHNGKKPDYYKIVRDDGYSSIAPISIFFDTSNLLELERITLDCCKGKILDIGAGAGRHSLELQRKRANITAIDISQIAVNIMKERGVKKVIHSDVMDLSIKKFDTLLMLMNGIGMVGDPENLDAFLIKAKQILTKNGIILFDSVDVSKTDNPKHVEYRKINISNSRLPGQQKLSIHYDDVSGDWFNWLHISFSEISIFAKKHNFYSELIQIKENGQYVAKLQKL